jgi:hypothetical protein
LLVNLVQQSIELDNTFLALKLGKSYRPWRKDTLRSKI